LFRTTADLKRASTVTQSPSLIAKEHRGSQSRGIKLGAMLSLTVRAQYF